MQFNLNTLKLTACLGREKQTQWVSLKIFQRDQSIYEQTNRGVIRSNLFCGEPQGKYSLFATLGYCQSGNIEAI
jgi:hypothetical protein